MLRPTNNDRAERAASAVAAHAGTRKAPADPTPRENMQDMLVDFMHLCDRESVDFDNLLSLATDHYGFEIDGPPKASR